MNRPQGQWNERRHIGLVLARFKARSLGPRRGMARDEQGAAILIRQDRRLKRANGLGLSYDFRFVHTDQRPQHRQGGGRFDDPEIVQRLRGHLSEGLAGHQCLTIAVLGNGFGNAQHAAPVQHDAVGRRGHADDMLLNLAKRHQEEPGMVLVAGQQAGELAGFILGGPIQEWVTVKMDKIHAAAAFHQAIGGHRRIQTAGEQGDQPATNAIGQPARAGVFVEVDQGLTRDQFHMNIELGMLQTDAGIVRVHDVRANFVIHLLRTERQLFKRPPSRHPKAVKLPSV